MKNVYQLPCQRLLYDRLYPNYSYILITAPYKVLVSVDFNTNVYPDLLNFIFSDNFSHFDFFVNLNSNENYK